MLPENTSVTLILVCKTATFFPLDLNITWYKNGSDIIQKIEPNKTQTSAGLYEAWSYLTETDEVESGTVYTCQVSHISLPNPTNISYTFYSRVPLPDNPFHNWIFGCIGAGLIPLIIILFIVKRKGTCRKSKEGADQKTKARRMNE
ncbi:H-2 class I histocompatibility antigen, alpha chain-like [Amblyraja radiata]|uniref:H-2 class I histocompatibility antigen, alpha chain-like n=1 Tax=Amblyraja radiata TaxID=386614 RepID=UPI0014039C0E|nr:H-2 class I histocompatibility antigen, alpha chain-like [Amblyraja radiata]